MDALVFHSTNFDVIDKNNQPWLRLPQIGAALGYANIYKVQKVFDRHADEFTESMTAVVKLPTAGGEQETRIFSLRGCHLLAMLSRTKIAKEFRRWVLDILDKETGATNPRTEPEATPQLNSESEDDQRTRLALAALHGGRFMTYFGDGGVTVMVAIKRTAFMVEPEEIAGVLKEPGSVPLRLLPEIITACAERLGNANRLAG